MCRHLISILALSLAGFPAGWTNAANAQDMVITPEIMEVIRWMRAEEIVVTASKIAQKVGDAPATIMVITAEQIAERSYDYLDDALRDLPGFHFVHVHGSYPTLWSQRGLMGDENKRTLLLIDGIVENNILEGNVLGGPQYSLHNVKQIEVIWGPASALYGANAFNGIINIITKKGAEIDGFEYHKGFGSFNTEFDKFLIGTEKNGVDVTLSGSLYNTDGPVFEKLHPEFSTSFVRQAYSLVGRLRYKGAVFGFSRYDRPMGEGPFTNSPTEVFGLPLYGYENSEGQQEYGGYSPVGFNGEEGSLWHSVTNTGFVTVEHKVNEQLTLSGKVFARRSGIADDSFEYDYDNSLGDFYRYAYVHWSNTAGGDVQATYRLNDDQNVIAGLQIEQSDVEKGYRQAVPVTPLRNRNADTRISNIYNNLAAYAQYSHKFNLLHSAALTAGIRYDDNNVYGSTTNPRLGLVVHVNEQWRIKTLFGSAYRAPNNYELFTKTAVRIPNPDLQPEKVRTFEFGLSGSPDRNWLLEINGFYNDFSDIIVSNVDIGDTDGNGKPNTQNKNVGTAEIYGLEFKVAAKIGQLNGYANFTTQDGERKQPGLKIDPFNVADFTANFGLNAPAWDLFTIDGSVNVVGVRTTAPTNPRNFIDGYTRVNLAVTSRPMLNDKIRFTLAVQNLLDAEYLDPGIRAANGQYYSTQLYQPGRTIYVKLTGVYPLSSQKEAAK